MKYFAIFSFLILTSSCSSLSIDKEKITKITKIFFSDYEEVNLTPEDTTEFQCANNEFFYLKYLDENNSVWVILKDRELRLDRVEGENTSYANSTTNLDIEEEIAVIKVDSTALYEKCKKKRPKA
mgnify:FL=1|jgi:hypothetical protein|tara:strand:+ start:258 stop:632 length:375 start_codon:yes stop_codon:yes gene_type:complete